MGNNSNWKQKLSSVFDIIGEILAVLYVLLFALLLIDAQWPFLSNVEGLKEIFQTIMIYGGFVIAGIVGIEAMIKHNLIFILVFAVILAVCVIFLFFPDTYTNLLGFLPKE